MADDPRKPIVAVMAKLGRETQLHLDERYRHFRVTDAVIIGISVVLVVLAVFNIYYVRVVYNNLDGIVGNMDSMYNNLKRVDENMNVITDKVGRFAGHVQYMTTIEQDVHGLAQTIPQIRGNMGGISETMGDIRQDMDLLGQAMGNMDQRMHHMIGGVAVMRENVRQMAVPMSKMNPFLP
jgi:uncharacterized protein YoxC